MTYAREAAELHALEEASTYPVGWVKQSPLIVLDGGPWNVTGVLCMVSLM